MVTAEDVVAIYYRLAAQSIPLWLGGGWGIDALLQEQTRPHKDLDMLVPADDGVRMCELLGQDGYTLKELWSENRWAVDARGVEIATAFVLHDAAGREIDAHALRFDAAGNGIPTWDNPVELVFAPPDLAGVGRVAGVAVPCLTPEKQVVCHAGYDLPDSHRRDLELLHARFGVGYPDHWEADQ